MIFADWQGINEVKAPHTLKQGELTIGENVVCRSDVMSKIPGTDEHAVGLPERVPWVRRYYGIRADNTQVKRTFCYSGDSIYAVNDVTKAVTKSQGSFTTGVRPESVFVRKGGNTVLLFFTGEDRPYEYDGNDSLKWVLSDITSNFVMGVWWLNRLWAFTKYSSFLYYSKTDYPTNFTDSTDAGYLPIASADRGYIVAIALMGDFLFIFKNTGIYYIEGRVPSTFAVKTIFDDRGLATKRALCKVSSGIVLLCEQDKRWYEFTGSQTGWRDISRNLRFPDRINVARIDQISTVWHNNLFRVSYPDIRDGGIKPERELIFPTDEVREDTQPKWSNTKGANIDSYDIMNQQGDGNTLITGRSDTGKIMRHGSNTNWDETAIPVHIRTKDHIGALGYNTEFKDINISGKSNSVDLTLKYYLDSRDETHGSDTIDQSGETSTSPFGLAAGVIQQARFNDYLHLGTGYNIGETLAIDITNETLNSNMHIYEMYIRERRLHRKRSKVVGG